MERSLSLYYEGNFRVGRPTKKYLHLPSNLVINIFTLTDNVLELKVNLEKYIFHMHYSVYSNLLAAQIFADICQHLRALAQLIVNKLRGTDSNIPADK